MNVGSGVPTGALLMLPNVVSEEVGLAAGTGSVEAGICGEAALRVCVVPLGSRLEAC